MKRQPFAIFGKRFVFRRFVLGYFTVALALILLLTMCMMVLSVRQYQKEWETSNVSKLQQIRDSLDQQFKTFLSIGTQINSNPLFLVRNIARDYPSYEAVKDLAVYAGFSSLASDFLLIYDDDQVQHMYSAKGAMNIAYYDMYYAMDAFPLETVRQAMSTGKITLMKTLQRSFVIPSGQTAFQKRQILICVVPPGVTGYNVPAMMLFFMEPKQVFSGFDILFENVKHHAFIRTEEGALDDSDAGALQGGATLSLASALFPWSYCVELERADFFHSWIFYLLILAFLTAALLALSASYFLAHRNYVPIQSLLNHLQPQGTQLKDNENEFAYINGILETLSVREDALAVPDNLMALLSTYLTTDILPEVHDALHLPPAPCSFALILFHNATQSERETDLSARLRELPDAPVVLTAKLDFSQEILALLAWGKAPVRRSVVQELEALHQQYIGADSLMSIIVSPFFDEINQVQRHFYQMQYVARYQFTPGRLFLDMELLSVMEKSYIDMNYHSLCHDLYNQLITGDVKLAQATIRQVLGYMNDADSSCNIGVFYMTLLSVFQQVNEKVLRNEELRQIISELLSVGASAQRDVSLSLERCLQRIVELMESQKSPLQCEAVRSVVEAHYDSPNFSLQFLADAFGVSSPTMSRFFKSEIGKGLSEYVTERRIEDAARLLKESDLPVKEIAKKVGYNDVNTFIRRFKAITGSTPTEYRAF